MIDIDYTKYLKYLEIRVKIIENFAHEFAFSMQLLRDNQVALTLVKNVYIYKKLKYIDVTYYYIRDLCKNNRIRVAFVSNVKIIANKLTKLLLKNKFKIFVKQLEMQNLSNNRNQHIDIQRINKSC